VAELMTCPGSLSREERVLVLALTPADAALTRALLSEAGLECHVCEDFAGVCCEFAAGAAAVLLTEDALTGGDPTGFADALRKQPPWSDVPVLLVTNGGADSPASAGAMDLLGNVTVLERPIRATTLVSALRTALRARRRQYEFRDRVETYRKEGRKKDDFLAVLAHELRNPLAPIRNAVEYLRLKGPADPDLQGVRDIVERQVRQLTRLVDDLLDVGRITRGKVVLRRERANLGVVLANAVESCRPLIEAGGHDLTVVVPPEPLFVDADVARLAQVFGNLLTNAAKYTDRGGRIRVAAGRQGDDAVVSVADTGIGIAAGHLPGVFDMFSQVAPAQERSQGGLGIGLALVRSRGELHGGRVGGPGRGSEFTVRLPLLVGPAGRAGSAGPAGAGGPRPGCRVLVADDNEDAAQSLAMMLSVLGHEVRTAADGVAAVELGARFRPDVALLDIEMPRLNGYEAARQIRRQPWGERVTLVAFTGWGQDEDKRRAVAAGFDHHFTKPVDPAVLQKLLAGASRAE
jgi:signal transduction histidine kinase